MGVFISREARNEDPICISERLLLLVGERFDAGQFLAFKEFKRRAAASGDVSDFVGYSGGVDGGYGIASPYKGKRPPVSGVGGVVGGQGIAAAYDGNRAAVVGDGVGDFESAFGEGRDFEDAHGAVPDDGAGRE